MGTGSVHLGVPHTWDVRCVAAVHVPRAKLAKVSHVRRQFQGKVLRWLDGSFTTHHTNTIRYAPSIAFLSLHLNDGTAPSVENAPFQSVTESKGGSKNVPPRHPAASSLELSL